MFSSASVFVRFGLICRDANSQQQVHTHVHGSLLLLHRKLKATQYTNKCAHDATIGSKVELTLSTLPGLILFTSWQSSMPSLSCSWMESSGSSDSPNVVIHSWSSASSRCFVLVILIFHFIFGTLGDWQYDIVPHPVPDSGLQTYFVFTLFCLLRFFFVFFFPIYGSL